VMLCAGAVWAAASSLWHRDTLNTVNK